MFLTLGLPLYVSHVLSYIFHALLLPGEPTVVTGGTPPTGARSTSLLAFYIKIHIFCILIIICFYFFLSLKLKRAVCSELTSLPFVLQHPQCVAHVSRIAGAAVAFTCASGSTVPTSVNHSYREQNPVTLKK